MQLLNVAGGMVLMFLSGPALAYDCAISGTPLNFGSVEGIAGRIQQSTATLTVVCRTGNTPANVSYQILMVGPAGDAQRQMSAGEHITGYQLYTSGSYQQVWSNTGDGIISDSYSLGANATVTRNYTVYAKMKTDRAASPGTYTANLAVQLVY
ncbi:spore coat protein U domain-containing protein [Sodalis sp. dw_96]|uniref:spore coat protein U domain-containing protein n=1 Tax=Sodalis sp. dw_96 TaxID=2719794 RepID=UPI001BD5E80D|nr:spore coat protein U domain-containing protein [Sodalis sp. dw_96]